MKLIALAGVLVVLVIGYVVARNVSAPKSAQEETGDFPLCAYATDELTSLRWTSESGSWHFIRQNSVWVNADDPHFPVNQSTLDAMAGRIAGLVATREIDDVPSLADYGLDAPVLTVTAGSAQGEITYAMGDQTPFADGYYVSVSGNDAVYTIESTLMTTFDKGIDELAAMETLPAAEHVTRIVAGLTLDASLDEESGLWHDAQTGELLDGESVNALVSGAQSLAWQTLVAVSVEGEALDAYGLGESAVRLSLYDGETEAFALLLGSEDDDGNRYARLPDSGMVYTVYGGDVSDLLSAGVDTLFARKPVTASLDEVEQAVFTWDGGTLTWERAPEADETEDAAEDEVKFTINGEVADVSGLWERLLALEGTSRVVEAASGEPVLAFSITDINGATSEVSIYPRDVDSYLVPLSQGSAMLLPADDVDRIVRELKSLNAAL